MELYSVFKTGVIKVSKLVTAYCDQTVPASIPTRVFVYNTLP